MEGEKRFGARNSTVKGLVCVSPKRGTKDQPLPDGENRTVGFHQTLLKKTRPIFVGRVMEANWLQVSRKGQKESGGKTLGRGLGVGGFPKHTWGQEGQGKGKILPLQVEQGGSGVKFSGGYKKAWGTEREAWEGRQIIIERRSGHPKGPFSRERQYRVTGGSLKPENS